MNGRITSIDPTTAARKPVLRRNADEAAAELREYITGMNAELEHLVPDAWLKFKFGKR